MQKAVIEGKQCFCKCGQPLGNKKDHRLVRDIDNGNLYVQFICYCSAQGCRVISQYCTDLELKGNRVAIDNERLEVIKGLSDVSTMKDNNDFIKEDE